MINIGIYTIVYADGQHRTLQIKDWNGKTIAGYLAGPDNEKSYKFFGFLTSENRINFWRSFSGSQTPERMRLIQRAIDIIASDPSKAGMAYALHSSRCYRCNRTLTVPASIHNGLGPDCAKKAA